jgi:hypothetical protein
MQLKLTLLRGFKVVGEGTLSLYPSVVGTAEIAEERHKQSQAEQVAKWMLATEQAINAAGPLRAHLELID